MNPRRERPSTVGGVNRRISTLLVALAPIVAFGVLLALVTVPYVSLGPGPTFDTLGEVEGKEVVDIEGTEVHPTTGHLNMTTVSQRDNLTLGQALTLWVSGREQLVPRDLVYPPDKSKDEIDEANNQEFKRSEDSAEYAALGYLKYAPAVTVETVSEDGASKGKLNEGDAIDGVDGVPVTSLDAVSIDHGEDQAGPGGRARLPPQERAARRHDDQASAPTRTSRTGILGIGVVEAPWAPFTIDFNLANIGGPSAGLVFSLAVIDKLTTGELSGSKFVAGTGTIDADGKVGSIGGITHKILAAHEAGATVFLVPADNCEEAKSAHEDGIDLVKVANLGDAVDALNALSAGGEAPRC